MEINKDLLIFTTISTEDERWRIEALLGDKGYTMPSIICKEIDFEADNESWIIGKLLKHLDRVLYSFDHKKTKKSMKFLNKQGINKEDFLQVFKLIKQAQELKFFNDQSK